MTHEFLDILADSTAADLEMLATHNPRIRRGVVAILDLLCSLDPEQMQNLLGERLAESWHDDSLEIF